MISLLRQEYESECWVSDREILQKIKLAARLQAEDKTLWFVIIPGDEFKLRNGEAYIQQSLRWLHMVIEESGQPQQMAFNAIAAQAKVVGNESR